MLRVVVSGRVEGVRVVETIVVGGAGGDTDGDRVSAVVTRSVADVVLEVVGVVVVVVGLTVVEEVVVALVVAVVVVVVVIVVVVVLGLVVAAAVVVVVVVAVVVVDGAAVVLLDRVTYAKGVGVGGRVTPGRND